MLQMLIFKAKNISKVRFLFYIIHIIYKDPHECLVFKVLLDSNVTLWHIGENQEIRIIKWYALSLEGK